MRYKTFRQRSSLSSSSSSTASATHSLSSGDWLDPDASIHSTENHQRFGRSGSSSSSKRVLFPWLTRLQHGTIQFKSVGDSPGALLTNLTSDEDSSITIDRQFVYFPAGYFSQSDNALQEMLHALGLYKLPNLLIVSADTDGVIEEQVMTGDECKNDEPLTYLEERESLLEKTHEILTGMLDHCDEINAWVLPQRPLCINGAAEVLCSAARGCKQVPVLLGLIGLDGDNNELEKKLAGDMVPVGKAAPWKVASWKVAPHVIEMCYDPDNPDQDSGTPCPGLTHLVFFQQHDDMREFRDLLRKLIPELLLMFGPATSYAKEYLFANIVCESPVALITHTAQGTNDTALMLKHVNQELIKYNIGATSPTIAMETHHVLGKKVNYLTHPIPTLLSLPKNLRDYLSKWPALHSSERVVLADPRTSNGIQFQQELMCAVKAAYYIRPARSTAVHLACQDLTALQNATKGEHRCTETYHIGMVITAFASIVAAVLYAKIFSNTPPPSIDNRDPYQLAGFLLTMILPLATVAAKKKYDYHSNTWSSLQSQAAALESIIFRFRTQMTTYGQPDSPMEPLDAFVDDVKTINSRVKELLSPKCAAPVEVMSKENIGAAKLHVLSALQGKVVLIVDSLKAKFPPGVKERLTGVSVPGIINSVHDPSAGIIIPTGKMSGAHNLNATTSHALSLLSGISIKSLIAKFPRVVKERLAGVGVPASSAEMMSSAPTNELARDKMFAEEDNDVEAPRAVESTPLLSTTTAAFPSENVPVSSLTGDEYSVILDGKAFAHVANLQGLDDKVLSRDDAETIDIISCSPMTIKDYIECRIHKEKDGKLTVIKTWENRNSMMNTVIKAVALLTMVLGMLSKQWAIPVAAGASSIFATSQEFRKYTKRIEQGIAFVQQLDELLAWWTKLDVEHKILQSNQDRLVSEAEGIIRTDAAMTY